MNNYTFRKMLDVDVIILTSFSANKEPSQSSLWRTENSGFLADKLRCLFYVRLVTSRSYICINLILEGEIET